ncbi:protein suppressor of variegation 3-7 [Musca vetustissima]|uniref:protein suppressor of variegation 3-7 n=1 Tax=Musca vetustissima TaxID=27455 RepID=UPI002AB5FE48|nr:protein suppressor of variegation 3-7 [Musca vetustissima]
MQDILEDNGALNVVKEARASSQDDSTSQGIINDESMIVEALNDSTAEQNELVSNTMETNDHDGSAENDNYQTLDISGNGNRTEFVVVSSTSIVCEDLPPNADGGIKDELTEPITNVITISDVYENDPMDLLVFNGRGDVNSSKSNEEEGDNEEPFDDFSSNGSSSTHGTSLSSIIKEWCKDYPWLLYDEIDEGFGYCLHCDVRLSVRSPSYIKQHSMSLYHKERSDNYLSFREEEERNNIGTPLPEIKQEFGTESYVAALRLKRKSQAEALNNYNWRRWLKEYPWLERDSTTGTIGLCKYCNVRINVEFSYLRTRHQETAKHKENEKEYNSAQQDNSSLNKSNSQQSKIKSNKDLSEAVHEQFAALRCKICDITVAKNNFKRHLRTNLHMQKESEYVKSKKPKKNKRKKSNESDSTSQASHQWHVYAKKHPWLIADPSDETQAYCKYCEKRVMYGNSVAKRTTHENSAYHKNKERNINGNDSREEERSNNDENSVEEENNDDESTDENNTEIEDDDDDRHEDNDEASEASDDEPEEDAVKDHDNRKKGGDHNESNRTENNEQDNDDDNNESSYCKIVISKTCNRMKHSQSGRHVAAEAEYLRRQTKKKKIYMSKNSDETYDWAVDIKSQPNLYYCKYCRVRISRRYSKKQHSISKVHQINTNLFKTTRGNPLKQESNMVAHTSNNRRQDTPSKIEKVPSFLTLVKQWQKRFAWLTYKRSEIRSNYAYCKICEQSVFLRTIKSVIKHQRSGKHIRTANLLRRQKLQQQREEQDEANKHLTGGTKREMESVKSKDSLQAKPKPDSLHTSPDTKITSNDIADNSIIEDLQKRYSWIQRSTKPNYGHCEYCNENVSLKPMLLRNHSNSRNHRQFVIKHRVNETKREKRPHSESNTNAEDVEDNDVILIEDNPEEILISEQDDNWTVKSENMDEHEALDFLLQRSNKSARSPHQFDGGPSKRLKKSGQLHRLNENNASLVASILSTPLTLASYLGPLIQQQIQQATSTQCQQSATQPTTSGNSTLENSFDLFFKSVSETMKNLPTDLAAEGKVKIMQIICDLELKALKRQELSHPVDVEIATSDSSSNLNTNHLSETVSTSESNRAEIPEVNASNPAHNKGTSSQQYEDTFTETIITPIPDETPANSQHQSVKSHTTTTTSIPQASESNRDVKMNISPSPIIGVIDKSGIHPLQFKNTTLVKHISKQCINPTNTTIVSNSAIRCIPLKSLSQSVGSETNTKFKRIQMPMTTSPTIPHHSPQSPPNINSHERPKGSIINVRNIQIAKRSSLVQQSTAPATVTTNSISGLNSIYTVTAPNIQRWTTSQNGTVQGCTMKKQIPVNTYHIPKQNIPQTSRTFTH